VLGAVRRDPETRPRRFLRAPNGRGRGPSSGPGQPVAQADEQLRHDASATINQAHRLLASAPRECVDPKIQKFYYVRSRLGLFMGIAHRISEKKRLQIY